MEMLQSQLEGKSTDFNLKNCGFLIKAPVEIPRNYQTLSNVGNFNRYTYNRYK